MRPPSTHVFTQRPSRCAASLAAAFALVALATGCQPKIGDPCTRSIDCSVRGERQCDLSNAKYTRQGNGECTIENCSYGSCPDEAVCIKVYGSDFLTIACDPEAEDLEFRCPSGYEIADSGACSGQCVNVDDATDCRDTVLVDDCLPNETCLPEGLCADELSARTSCRLECDTDKDCRAAFECKRIGTNGVYVSPKPKNPTRVRTAKICVPREQ